MDVTDVAVVKLDELIAHLEIQNEPGSEHRSRELSLAITKLQEAKHWLLADGS